MLHIMNETKPFHRHYRIFTKERRHGSKFEYLKLFEKINISFHHGGAIRRLLIMHMYVPRAPFCSKCTYKF